ncbi:cell cycle and ribosome biogenesis protein (nucleomorph) [Bigelowiella natans]|uniref:Cell cycle and ribosome biogenesis protein n=1 Tax=Bigelowiella natans TaxID=227086 RepID=Q3LW83_BIGNA|nr:cell cycle and ribosome biogenesis protein [Bigelowiella natans]ABA27283.1 cell cycle and ribosome biogenesis protein [Bigelowiella natans]
MKEIECCFRIKKDLLNLCRLKENISGYCKKAFCPLVQRDYAFVEKQQGKIYLYTKKMQNNLRIHWSKYLLSENFIKALEQLEVILNRWPKYFLHFNKTKLTILYDNIVSRKKRQEEGKLYIDLNKKKKNKIIRKVLIKRHNNYEIMKNIKKELLKRLKSGFYGNVFKNFGSKSLNFKKKSPLETKLLNVKSSTYKSNLS